MPRTLPVPPLGSSFDFSSEFLPEEVDYSEAFDFGVDFSFLPEVDFLATSTPGDDEFEYDNVSCDRGSTRENVIFSNSLWTNSEYPNLLKNMFIWSL